MLILLGWVVVYKQVDIQNEGLYMKVLGSLTQWRQKSPPVWCNSGIWPPAVIILGMIWGKNFSNLAKQFMTSWPLFKCDVISDFNCIATAKNVSNRNFIVIPLFLNEVSSNLVHGVKIRSWFIFVAQTLLFFIIYYHFTIPICPVLDFRVRLLDHVISCDRNLKISCDRGYQQDLKSVFYYLQNSLLHLFQHLLSEYWSFLCFLLCVEKNRICRQTQY